MEELKSGQESTDGSKMVARASEFFDLARQKKDSTVSLSENDANSPRTDYIGGPVEKHIIGLPATSANEAHNAVEGLDF